jgi:hypothetical protein
VVQALLVLPHQLVERLMARALFAEEAEQFLVGQSVHAAVR